MNNLAEVKVTEPNKGRQRDMLNYNARPAIKFLHEEALANDGELEEAITIVVAGMREGSIKSDVGQELLIHLFTSFRTNDHMVDVSQMLERNPLTDSLAEVDRIHALRRRLTGTTKS